MFVNAAMTMPRGVEATVWVAAPWGMGAAGSAMGCPVPPPSQEHGSGTALEIGTSVGTRVSQEGSRVSAHGFAWLSGHVAGQGWAGMGARAVGRGERAWRARQCLWVLPRP